MKLQQIFENESDEENIKNIENNRTITISFDNYEAFLKLLADLNKKAKKYGVPEIRIISKEKIYKKHNSLNPIPFYKMVVSGDPVKINGWNFLATVEHTPNGKNVIRIAPGVHDSKIGEYLGSSNRECDYCHTNRDRNNTFLIKNEETGEYKRVGGNCLKKYFGDAFAKMAVDAFKLDAAFFDGVESLSDNDDDPMLAPESRKNRTAFDVDTVLGVALYWTEKIGYKPRGGSGAGLSTPDVVFATLIQDPKIEENDILQALGTKKTQHEKIEKMKKWIQNLPEEKLQNSNYFFSLKSIIDADYVTLKSVGLIASMPISFIKNEELEKRQQHNGAGQYIGAVGQKIGPIKIKVIGAYTGNGQYGPYQIVKMQDNEGNQYTWFNTSTQEIEDGKNYTMSATVKKHEEYKGVKSTVLTRAKLSEE
jgi:hypothetical protein